ncbi:MAG: ATP-dependent sacrificial sulfur transferase LarE, partial [Acidimicrobiia bacterium]
VLGADSVRAVTAVSPSLADHDRVHCERLARDWRLDWSVIDTDEMADDRYLANDVDRCYWCKSHLMDGLVPIAGGATIVLGVNVDDLGDHRPGQRAARERGARFPLVEVGLGKLEIRTLSRAIGLETWDRPAAPCLSSRLPYGTPVTLGRLSQVERAERGLRRLGLVEVRVRHHGDVGLVEVTADEIERAAGCRAEIADVVRAAGFRFVGLDLEGLQSGRLNRGHVDPSAR